jgi:dihydrofolate synthase/folylpolyglutamate synthase
LAKSAASAPSTRRVKKPVQVKLVEPAPTVRLKAPSFEGFQDAVRWLYDRTDIERMRPTPQARDLMKLDRMRRLLEILENPQESLRCVHVAGTKGKGSTCEMTASCLEACGYTVGLYTSPHLVDVRERIRINRKTISHGDFTRLAQAVASATTKLDAKDGEATFFELITAMAFVHFAEEAVDAAVIECGLGGRLDSTNVIVPEVSAITSLSLDHTQILGATIDRIAAEKAGIFKPGVPAVTVPQAPEAMAVLKKVAEEVGAPLQVLGEELDFTLRFDAVGGAGAGAGPQTRVSLTTSRSAYEHLTVPLKGEHQAYNCGLALAILDRLTERGFQAPESKVTIGLARVECPGRLEVVPGVPRIVLDGAHNPASIRCLMRAIGAHLSYDSMVVIFGCAADKDIPGMLKQLDLGADKAIFTRAAGNVRAADPKDLARVFTEAAGKMSQTAPTLAEALDLARRGVGRDDLICITGSFYLVGEAKKLLKDCAVKR